MQPAQLNRVLDLVRRTGDRCVILDKESDAVFVMMDVGEYEFLLNDSHQEKDIDESDMVERANRELSYWRSRQAGEAVEIDHSEEELAEEGEEAAEETQVEKEVEPDNIELKYVATENILSSGIGQVMQAEQSEGEEDLSEVPDDGEEERFYLEPVE